MNICNLVIYFLGNKHNKIQILIKDKLLLTTYKISLKEYQQKLKEFVDKDILDVYIKEEYKAIPSFNDYTANIIINNPSLLNKWITLANNNIFYIKSDDEGSFRRTLDNFIRYSEKELPESFKSFLIKNPKVIGDVLDKLTGNVLLTKDIIDTFESYCEIIDNPDNYSKIYFALLDMHVTEDTNDMDQKFVSNYNILYDSFAKYYERIKNYFIKSERTYFLETMEEIYEKGKLPEIKQESFKSFFMAKYL
jgi:hypothetical protein